MRMIWSTGVGLRSHSPEGCADCAPHEPRYFKFKEYELIAMVSTWLTSNHPLYQYFHNEISQQLLERANGTEDV